MRPALIAMSILTASAVATYALSLAEIDADGDGGLTLAEIQSVHPDVTEAVFLEADTDANGMISADELATAQEIGLIPADQG